MAYPTNCILHNLLGSAAEVGASVIGPNGTITEAVTYGACKFGNGVRGSAVNTGLILFAYDTTYRNKGCLEMWFKALVNSDVAASYQGFFGIDNGGSTNFWGIYTEQASGHYYLCPQKKDPTYGQKTYGQVYEMIFSANDFFHLAFVWDKDKGFDGTKTMAIYKDNVQVWATTDDFNFVVLNSVEVLNYNITAPCTAQEFLEDNIKLWNYPKTDFSDRNYEYGPEILAPANVSATDGTYFSKTTITWDASAGATLYNVYRATTADGTYTELSGWQAELTYDDTTAIAGIIYYYKVKAKDDTLESDYSDYNGGYRLANTAVIISSQGTYTDHIFNSWSAVTGAAQYDLYRATSLSGSYISISGWQSGLNYDDTDIIPNTDYFYKLKCKTAGGDESDLSSASKGWATLLTEQPKTEIISQPAKTLVLLDGIDIYALGYIQALGNIKEEKTFKRDKLISNEFQIICKNFNNFFSCDNSSSLFSRIQWLYKPLVIINDSEIKIWDGVITDIIRNHKSKTAIIKSNDAVFKLRNTKITYTSTDWETAADAFKNICDNYGFTDYNNMSLQQSIVKLEQANCYIKCQWAEDDDITFQQAIEKLGEISCSDVFSHNNKIYFRHWYSYLGGASINLTDADLLDDELQVESLEYEMINDYRILYNCLACAPVTDEGNNNIGELSRSRHGLHSLPEIDGTESSDIIIKDLTSAIYIGETYMRRTHNKLETQPKPLTAIKFSLKGDHFEWIDLLSYFRLTLSDESWASKLFEVYAIEYQIERLKTKVLAIEVV